MASFLKMALFICLLITLLFVAQVSSRPVAASAEEDADDDTEVSATSGRFNTALSIYIRLKPCINCLL